MSAERPTLTQDAVQRAEARVDVAHPVITVLDQQAPRLAELQQGYAHITDNQEQQRFISEQYGFLADSIVEAGPFTLEPVELIAVWSKATEMLGGYERYALAGMVSTAYAIQGASNPDWRSFPRSYIEREGVPEGVRTDAEGLQHVRERLRDIWDSTNEIDFYVYGTNEGAMGLAFKLGKRESEGDEEAKKMLEELIAREKEFKTPVLTEIHENFANVLPILRWTLDEAIEELPGKLE